MFNQDNVPPPEYRVRPVLRYVVTRYCHPYNHRVESDTSVQGDVIPVPGNCKALCEVPSEQGAFEIAEAMAKAEGATVQRD